VYTVLANIESEISDPESVINKADDNRARELRHHIEGCERYLGRLDLVLTKYNALSENERSFTKLWQKIRFGNKEVTNVRDVRQKITTYTAAISTTLQLMSMGSQGRVERKLHRQGGQLDGICEKVNLVLARLNTTCPEGTVMTNYTNDDKAFWKAFRRELVKEGYSSKVLYGRPEALIKAYVRELGDRGVLDEGLDVSRPPIPTDVELLEPSQPIEIPTSDIDVDPTYGSSIEIEEEHSNSNTSNDRSTEHGKPHPVSSSGPFHQCDKPQSALPSFSEDGGKVSEAISTQQQGSSQNPTDGSNPKSNLDYVVFTKYTCIYADWETIRWSSIGE